TLDLARLRVVDPVLLSDLGHFLPATYLAFNAHADAVSSDLNLLAPEAAEGIADAIHHHLVADRTADVRFHGHRLRRPRPRPAVVAGAPVAGGRVPGRGRGDAHRGAVAGPGGAADPVRGGPHPDQHPTRCAPLRCVGGAAGDAGR